jgi:glycosyltransferase involved in cell wall biosynthesis
MRNSFAADPHPGRPKILFIGFGESTHTHSWIDLLAGSNFNVRLFALPTPAVPPDHWKVRTYVTGRTSVPLDPDTRARLYSLSPARRLGRKAYNTFFSDGLVDPAEKWLAQIIKDWRPDIIHTLGIDSASYFYWNVRQNFGVGDIGAWVLQVRGGPDLALHRLVPEHVDRIQAVIKECDLLIADNQQNYDLAMKMGMGSEQLSPLGIVPGTGGIDVTEMSQSWAGPPSQRRMVLWPVAYECPQKKALPVLEALKLAWDHIQPCEVQILSTIPETRMWFATLPEQIRAGCRVHDRIDRAKVLDLMTRARVMLAPSLSDGIPNSMYEAMACGAFPIVSPLDTIRPVVENERNVLFARNLYPHEIADALCRAMSDDALVDAAAERNLELVSRVADRTRIKPRVVEFYERLAG